MINTGHLYSKDNNRIFINTCLGCNGNCSCCYLKKMGYENDVSENNIKKAEEIISEINKLGISKDTLITLGCFSECWDEKNKPETIKLIEHFLKAGNQVQISTKKEITVEEAKRFKPLIQYYGQLVIYVSSATLSKWSDLEKGTEPPAKRFKTFRISDEFDIPTVLYMKPVLKGVTVQDIELYKKAIQRFRIKDVVVGSVFGEKKTEETVPFSEEQKLFYNPVSDEMEIKRKLMELGNVRVFSRSSKVMQYYKEKNKKAIR